MDPVHKDLFDRIEAYDLAGDGSPRSFSGKLAKQNRWTPAFTARVIEEYKRYAFLSVAAGHPVAPSDVVDQPWHLHLMYTQDYWGTFCPHILGKKLHHQPSTGAPEEHAKFDDWYRRTLESYERLFGEKPPPDIWPPADRPPRHARERPSDHVRVDRATHWIVPRPHLPHLRQIRPLTLASVGLILVSLGCADAAVSANPLDWAGQEFLAFYTTLYFVCFAAAWAFRNSLRKPVRGDMKLIRTLDPYAVGYLSGGAATAANVAIAGLVHDGSLEFDPTTRTLNHGSFAPPDDANMRPIDQRVHKAVASIPGGSIHVIRNVVAGSIGPISEELRSKGLLMTDDQARAAVIVPFMTAMLPLIVGAGKIAIGIKRDRPVDILVFLVLMSLVANIAAFLRKLTRTRFGDSVITTMRVKNSRYQNPGAEAIGDPNQELMLGVALFGVGTLAGTGLDLALAPPRTYTSSGSCSGGGSSCGGTSSCGGGGGGGCGGGGGGCGGCSS